MSTINLKQIAREYGALMYREGCVSNRSALQLRREAAAKLAEFDAAVDALQRDTQDAARYRWLREQPNNTNAPRIDVVYWTTEDESANAGEGLRTEQLDAAIDAQRDQSEKGSTS